MAERKKVLLAFGSPSDVTALPEFERYKDMDYYLSVASAHRTHDVVKCHAVCNKWDAIVAGAGLTNALKDAYLVNAPDAVLVTLPMPDSRTDGLSSILSSSEMPPGYPVAMARMGDIPAAVRFANRALARNYDTVNLHTDGSDDAHKALQDAEKTLRELGVNVDWAPDPQHDRLNLFIYSYLHNPNVLDIFRDIPAVACYATPIKPLHASFGKDDSGFRKLGYYLKILDSAPSLVHTGVADGGNLGLYAAKIVARHDGDVRERIARKLADGRKKYDDFVNVRQI